jgi:hypothetical protein
MAGGGFTPIDGAASTMNAPGAGPMSGAPGAGMPGGLPLAAAAQKGHRKKGHSLHGGPHTKHRGKKAAGKKVSQRKGG